MKYYAYIRVSTTTQAIKGYGIDTQKEKIEKWAQDNNIILEEIFIDAGVSGTTTNRNALTDLLCALQDNDKVVVLNTSRLWREDTVKILIQHKLKKVGADIISLEQTNYSLYDMGANDFLINGILELLDQYDRMNISMKLASGRRTKARQGSKSCGVAPFGYKWDKKSIVVEEKEAVVLLDMMEHLSESHSFAETERYAKSQGYLTRQGKNFSRQAIKNMAENDFYIGIVSHANRKSQGTHPALYSTELWNKLNKVA